MTVDQDYRVKLKQIIKNTSYEPLDGRNIFLPDDFCAFPSREAPKKKGETDRTYMKARLYNSSRLSILNVQNEKV
ncbi:MAG: hypothetical protein AB2L18_12865 [Anaerolineaceae bacterium]|jgi:hypothetical protein